MARPDYSGRREESPGGTGTRIKTEEEEPKDISKEKGVGGTQRTQDWIGGRQ